MSRWPHDDPASLAEFYGKPGGDEIARQLVSVVPPFRMTYEGKPIKGITFHRKAAGALKAALDIIWEHYGRDQKKIDALGISRFAGSYNPRMIRGSSTRWSNHAYGAAIDLNAEDNGLNTKGNMPAAVVAAFESQGAKWGGRYKGRTDPMHFEFVDNGRNPVAPPAPAHVAKPESPGGASPKSMVTSKIGNAQIVAGGVTTVAAGAQVAKPFLETTSETITAINDIATPVGTIVETTKTVTTAVPEGLWITVVHALTSPPFIACATLVVLATASLTWYWRRQHRKAGV